MTLRRTGLGRYFVDGVHATGETVLVEGGDARKLSLVLRAQAGETVEICDSSGRAFDGRIVEVGPRVRIELGAGVASASTDEIEIVLAQAVPKGSKMDFVVEKATELGVSRIVPLVTERTLGDVARAGKLERWRRLARAAAQQSGRTRIPTVESPQAWTAFIGRSGYFGRVLVPWELAVRVALRQSLPPLLTGVNSVAVAIGPEGGFTHGEVEAACGHGAAAVSLGERILRTETAGLVVVAAVRYEAGEL